MFATFLAIAFTLVMSALALFASFVTFPPHHLSHRFSQRAFRRAAKRAGLWIDRGPWSLLAAWPPPKQQIRQIVHVYHQWPVPGGHAWDYDTWPGAAGVYRITLDTGEEIEFPDAHGVVEFLGFSLEEMRARSISREVPIPTMSRVYFLLVLAFDLSLTVWAGVSAWQCLVH